MDYKKQHYIPQSYLGRWCDINKPIGHDDYVWVFDYDGKNAKKKSPKNIFYETDLYTIYDDKGNRILDIEHGLSELESRFVSIRERKIEKHLELSIEERLIILAFIAAIHNRTPSVKAHISKTWGEILELGKAMRESYQKASPEQKRIMAEIGSLHNSDNSLSMEEAEKIHLEPLQTTMIPRIQTETELYSKMHMAILDTDDEIGFITSDQPCVWFDPEAYKRPPMYRSVGLGYRSVEVTLPISPKQAIIISHYKLPLYNTVNMSTVDSINRKTRFMANKYFVVNKFYKNDFWFKVLKPPAL